MLRTALRKRLRPSAHFQVLQTQKICCYIRAFRDFLNRHVINRAENLLYWEYLSLAYTIEGVTISSDSDRCYKHTQTHYIRVHYHQHTHSVKHKVKHALIQVHPHLHTLTFMLFCEVTHAHIHTQIVCKPHT